MEQERETGGAALVYFVTKPLIMVSIGQLSKPALVVLSINMTHDGKDLSLSHARVH